MKPRVSDLVITNLPLEIVFPNGKINYLYNASGQKVKKVVNANETITTDYLSGFQYHNNELKNFPHAEGYVTVVDGTMKYIYNYTDHLGNIRLSYSDADNDNVLEQNEIIEENHYYPFGLKHTAYNTNESQYIADEELNTIILEQMPKFAGDGNYNYKYNGKEYQDELGLNMYDYGARNYDPALGRWMNIDPLAEVSRKWSPYVYCYNNPIVFVDPDGMLATNPKYTSDKVNLRKEGRTNYMKLSSSWFGSNSERILTQQSGFNGVSVTANYTSNDEPSSIQDLGRSLGYLDTIDFSDIATSASVTTTSISGTFLNSKGETVNSAKDAVSLVVNKSEKTETVEIDKKGRISNDVDVKTVNSSTTYSVSFNEDGQYVLNSPSSLVDVKNETISYSTSTKDLRDYSFERSKTNIETQKENRDNYIDGVKGGVEALKNN